MPAQSGDFFGLPFESSGRPDIEPPDCAGDVELAPAEAASAEPAGRPLCDPLELPEPRLKPAPNWSPACAALPESGGGHANALEDEGAAAAPGELAAEPPREPKELDPEAFEPLPRDPNEPDPAAELLPLDPLPLNGNRLC